MALTRDYKETVLKRLCEDENMRIETLNDAMQAFVSGEPEVGKELLKDLIHATIGFERLADVLQKNSKSLHRMLSPSGNPTMTNFFIIVSALVSSMGANIGITRRAA